LSKLILMVRVFSWLLLLALPAILAEHEASQSTAPAWEPGAVSGVTVSFTSTRDSTFDKYARYVYSDGRQMCSCCAYLVWSGRGDLVLVL
jgi:hypothetical protein